MSARVGPAEPSPNEGRRPTLAAWGLLTAAVVTAFLWLSAPYGLPVLGGLILAAVAYPAYGKLRRHLRPTAAALTVTFGMVTGVVAPFTAITISALRESSKLAALVKSDGLSVDKLTAQAQRSPFVRHLFPGSAALRAQLRELLDAAAGSASEFAMHQLALLPEVVLQLLLLVTALFFFLIDGRRLYRWVRDRAPLPPAVFGRLACAFNGAARGSVLASLVASALHGVAIGATFVLVDVPAAALAAGAGFVLSWIPMFGVVPVWGAGILWLLSRDHTGLAAVVLAVALGVAILDTFVRPLVLRGHHEMHPLLGLVGIVGGLATIGILGLLIGPVLAALVVAVLDLWPVIANYCGVTLIAANPVEEVP